MKTLQKLKSRKLSFESLESRELLSVNPLLPLADDIESPFVQAAEMVPQAATVSENDEASDRNFVESHGLSVYWRQYGEEYRVWAITGITGSNLSGSLNLSSLDKLESVNIRDSQLTSLDVSGLTNLTSLYCVYNQLTSLNVSGCTKLETLYCYNNQLTSLNVSGVTNLKTLLCNYNQLTSLNVSGFTSLYELQCWENQLTSLNFSGCTNLRSLYCENNQLTSLNVSGCTNLQDLYCYNNQLTSLDVSSCTNLYFLWCDSNQLISLDVSGFTNLRSLYCENNQLTSLNVSGCTNLRGLGCENNQLTSLDVSGLTNLESLYCENNQLTSLDVSGLTNLESLYCENNQLTSLNVYDSTKLEDLNCDYNQLTFATLPFGNFISFTYGNQAEVPIGYEDDSILQTNFEDLESQYNAGSGTTTYTWYYENGTAVSSKLITNKNGTFTFDESLVGKKVYCVMTNTVFPDLMLYTTTAEIVEIVSFEVIAKQRIYDDYQVDDKLGGYTVSQIFTNSFGLNAAGLTRTVKGEQESILVFRGTSDILDVLADITKNGIGYDQYFASTRQQILDWATEAASKGILSAIGHSLGGALAQWFAADFTSQGGKLDKVETFNATGISKEYAEKFVAGNCQVIHNIVSGDAVSMFGEAFINGTVLIHKADAVNFANEVNLRARHSVLISDLQGNKYKNYSFETISATDLNNDWFHYKDTTYTALLAAATVALPLGTETAPYLFFRKTAENLRQNISENNTIKTVLSAVDSINRTGSFNIPKIELAENWLLEDTEITFDIDSKNIEASTNIDILNGFFKGSTELKLTYGKDTPSIYLKTSGTFNIPQTPLFGTWGGATLTSGELVLIYVPDNDFSNDFVAVKSSIVGNYGIEFKININNNSLTEFHIGGIKKVDLDAPESTIPFNTQAAQAMTTESMKDYLLLLNWDNTAQNTTGTIILKNGTRLTETEMLASGNFELVTDFCNETRRAYLVKSASAAEIATWEYEINNVTDTISPTLYSFVEPLEVNTKSITGGNGLPFVFDVDIPNGSPDTRLTFFLDQNHNGFNGKPIYSTTLDKLKNNSWTPENIPEGTYYVYVRAEGGEHVSETAYFDNPITITYIFLPTPENLRKTLVGKTAITLDWNNVDDATEYILQRKIGSGDWERIYSGSESQYVDQNLTAGTTYLYRVQAVGSEFSENVSVTTLPQTVADVPTIKEVTIDQNTKKATLEWSDLGTDYEYYVFRGGTNMTKDAQTDNTYVVDTNTINKTTSYFIYAYDKQTCKYTKSLPVILSNSPDRPEIASHSETAQSITLNWNIPDAGQFAVFRNDILVSPDNLSGQSWTDTNPLSGENLYTLYVFKESEGWIYSGPYVVHKTVTLPAAIPNTLDTFWRTYDLNLLEDVLTI